MNVTDFDHVLESHRRELLAHCYRMTGSVDDAEDLVQETFLRAWRAQDRFAGRSSLRTWLYRIATNVCLTALAKQRFLPSGLGPPAADPLGPAEPASGVAAAMDMSVAAVKSALQRAWATAAGLTPEQVTTPSAQARAVLERYVAAFENSDAAALERLLTDDAVLEMTGVRTWFAGKAACVPHLRAQALESPGDWRMVPAPANGQPAVVAYLRGEPYAVAVLTVAGERLARIAVFADRAVLARFT